MNGPSKEELQNYWNTSRKYFDELAKQYYTTDRKYYDEYIAPFYNNPLWISTQTVNSRKAPAVTIIVALVVGVIAAAGVALFVLIGNHESSNEKNTKKVDKIDTVNMKNDFDRKVSESPYFKGLKYISEKEYDKAEYYLKQVPKDDPDYESAKQVLESIKYLKKYDTR